MNRKSYAVGVVTRPSTGLSAHRRVRPCTGIFPQRERKSDSRFPLSDTCLSVFPETQISVVVALSSDDASIRSRAIDLVVSAYRTPVIVVLRRQWSLDLPDAEDLAHDFFAHALERDWLARYDRDKGRFRAFLRSCLTSRCR